jgi:hypothetical protein
MRHILLRGLVPATVLVLLSGCAAPGWEAPGASWFRRDAPPATVVVVAAPPQTQEERCAAQAWAAAARLPQDRQLAYSQEWNACMQSLAMARPVVVDTVPRTGVAPAVVVPGQRAVTPSPRPYRN